MLCEWEWWLSLRCQWELLVWMCLYLWSVTSSSIFLSFRYSGYSRHSGYSIINPDLFMINPHFSLNPQNSQISSAILRFHGDFHSEIHRFCEQSSDLVQGIYFIKSLPDLRIHSSALSDRVSVTIRGCHLHNLLCCPTFLSEL